MKMVERKFEEGGSITVPEDNGVVLSVCGKKGGDIWVYGGPEDVVEAAVYLLVGIAGQLDPVRVATMFAAARGVMVEKGVMPRELELKIAFCGHEIPIKAQDAMVEFLRMAADHLEDIKKDR